MASQNKEEIIASCNEFITKMQQQLMEWQNDMESHKKTRKDIKKKEKQLKLDEKKLEEQKESLDINWIDSYERINIAKNALMNDKADAEQELQRLFYITKQFPNIAEIKAAAARSIDMASSITGTNVTTK
jgi:hypothetical protein